jgi:hypothetical protein
MTPSTIDRPEIESRVRDALRARARSTMVKVPDGFTPGPVLHLASAGRARRRLAPVVAVAAVAVGVLAVGVLVTRGDGHADPATDSAPGLPVTAPTGSRWFVLDVPGATPGGVVREVRPATPAGPIDLQAFRTDAGFDGPAVWIERGVGAFGTGVQVTVKGWPAYLNENFDSAVLDWPGSQDDSHDDRFHIYATKLGRDDLIAFADGLEPRAGGGWDATVLPEGLAEVDVEADAQPASEHAEWIYANADGTGYQFLVDPGGASALEAAVRDQMLLGQAGMEAISVDGRPGVIMDHGAAATAVWRATDDIVVTLRTDLDRDGLLATLRQVQAVDEATWLAQFPADQRVGAPSPGEPTSGPPDGGTATGG